MGSCKTLNLGSRWPDPSFPSHLPLSTCPLLPPPVTLALFEPTLAPTPPSPSQGPYRSIPQILRAPSRLILVRRAQILKSFGLKFESQHCLLLTLWCWQITELLLSVQWNQNSNDELTLTECPLCARHCVKPFIYLHWVNPHNHRRRWFSSCLHCTGKENEIEVQQPAWGHTVNQSRNQGSSFCSLALESGCQEFRKAHPDGPGWVVVLRPSARVSPSSRFDLYSHSDI